jgi:hypothetical protein
MLSSIIQLWKKEKKGKVSIVRSEYVETTIINK